MEKVEGYLDAQSKSDWSARHADRIGCTDHDERPAAIFGSDVTPHLGPDRQAYVLLPIIPQRKKV